jgi:type VI secretion system protein VasI
MIKRISQKTAVLLLYGMMMSSTAHASEKDPASCHIFTSTTARLGCYDRATGFAEPAGATSSAISDEDSETTTEAQPVKPMGKWAVSTEKSPIDDTTNVFLSLASSEDISARFGGPGPMRVFLQCRENKTLIYFTFNGHFMSDHQHGKVTYRLDDAPSGTINMQESTDHEALGLWNGRASIPFVKKMFGHDTLLIRATPFSESPVTATFPITGLENAIEPLRKSCGW